MELVAIIITIALMLVVFKHMEDSDHERHEIFTNFSRMKVSGIVYKGVYYPVVEEKKEEAL